MKSTIQSNKRCRTLSFRWLLTHLPNLIGGSVPRSSVSIRALASCAFSILLSNIQCFCRVGWLMSSSTWSPAPPTAMFCKFCKESCDALAVAASLMHDCSIANERCVSFLPALHGPENLSSNLFATSFQSSQVCRELPGEKGL